MPGTSYGCGRPVRGTNERPLARWWLVVLVAVALVAFSYIYVAFWFAVHQREFQYTRGAQVGLPRRSGWMASPKFLSRLRTANTLLPGGHLLPPEPELCSTFTVLRRHCPIR